MGLELMTLRSRVMCCTDWASRSPKSRNILSNLDTHTHTSLPLVEKVLVWREHLNGSINKMVNLRWDSCWMAPRPEVSQYWSICLNVNSCVHWILFALAPYFQHLSVVFISLSMHTPILIHFMPGVLSPPYIYLCVYTHTHTHTHTYKMSSYLTGIFFLLSYAAISKSKNFIKVQK